MTFIGFPAKLRLPSTKWYLSSFLSPSLSFCTGLNRPRVVDFRLRTAKAKAALGLGDDVINCLVMNGVIRESPLFGHVAEVEQEKERYTQKLRVIAL